VDGLGSALKSQQVADCQEISKHAKILIWDLEKVGSKAVDLLDKFLQFQDFTTPTLKNALLNRGDLKSAFQIALSILSLLA
jgi:hypothetical protein